MKADIHPKYDLCTITCACGYSFVTRSTLPEIHLEICANCHPFFTGKQKLIDSAGRVERFTRRFEKTGGKTVRLKAKTKTPKPAPAVSTRKVLTTTAKVKKNKSEKPGKKVESPK